MLKNNLKEKRNNKKLDEIDIVKLYIQEASKYSTLTRKEEQKYEKYLQLYPEITDILSKVKINQNTETILNLEKILASIKTEEEREYITNILTRYYNEYGKQESKSDKVVMYYLQEYNKLCKSLHHIPTSLELTSYFSIPNKYNLFTDFTNVTKLESNELILKVSNYVKYMIAKNTMINCNLRLVTKMATKYYQLLSPKTMSFIDFINEGNIGLTKAVEKFDYSKGKNFALYATYWIFQSIIRAFQNQDKTIKIPVNIQDKCSSYYRKLDELKQKYGRELTEDEILKELDEMLILPETSFVFSLDAPIEIDSYSDSELTLLDLTPITTDASIENEVLSNFASEQIQSALETLPDRERIIMNLRFGFEDGRVHTLEEIGKIFCVTRERTRQLEKRALQSLRTSHPDLKEYL